MPMTRAEILAEAQRVFQLTDAPACEARDAAYAEADAMQVDYLAKLDDFYTYAKGMADVQLARAKRVIQRGYELQIAQAWATYEATVAAIPEELQ